MVQYGKAIKKARRQGWEDAYLDYTSLKSIIEDVESLLFSGDPEKVHLLANNAEVSLLMEGGLTKLEDLKAAFFQKLKVEIEKISLFAMKKQGQLADAVGSARFPTSLIFEKKSFELLQNHTKVEFYSIISVELVHLLKYVCLNAIGIQKILKKYNKIFDRIDETHFYSVESEHLRQLANSESIMAIQASLEAVLDECFKQENLRDPDIALGLLRFQCIMECTSILKKNARLIHLPFMDFISKQSIIMTKTAIGGLDGVGQRALQWLLRLDPEQMQTMNQSQLQRMWQTWSSQTELVSSHLDGGLPYRHRRIPTYIGEAALEAMQEPTAEEHVETKWAWGGVSTASMALNLSSIALYTINYYIVAPTANHYAMGLGMDGAFGATLIGASSFSALFSAFVYSLWYTRSNFKSALIFSAVCPLFGNLLYAIAISYSSMPIAIVGRIFCGFGSAEVLNRQLIATSVRFDDMTRASALFVAFGASGMSLGPLLAGILDLTAGRDTRVDFPLPFMPAGGVIFDAVTAPGFLMAALWLIQLVSLIFLFHEPIRINSGDRQNKSDSEKESGIEDFSSSFRVVDESILKRLDSLTFDDGGAYGSLEGSLESVEPYAVFRCMGPRDLWEEMVATWSLVFENMGLPITLLLFAYIELACEIIISSCSMVVRRYFGWHGSAAGFLIAALGTLVLPAHFVVEHASRHISERKILIRSLWAIVLCVFAIFNYSGLWYDVIGLLVVEDDTPDHVIKETKLKGVKVKKILTSDGEIYYNWDYGVPFYVVFLSLLFMSTIVLEGVDTSIMAKVTPPKLNGKFINGGLLATLIGTLGRVVGDSILTVSALLDLNIFIDFVNATFFPILLLASIGIFLSNKYYHSLV